MAFEEGTPGVGVGSRYLGQGFRLEPDFREGTGNQPLVSTSLVSPPALDDGPSPRVGVARRRPNLNWVFDDPAVGEPGRDRMLIHGVWELLLAVAVVGVGYLLLRERGDALGGASLRSLLLSAAALGLLVSASAVALRAAVPNLAVGSVAIATALYFGHSSAGGLLSPVVIVVGVCAAIGVVQGLVVVGLHVPGWAAGLGVGLVLLLWSNRQSPVALNDGYDPLPHAYWWFGGFCAVSIGACVVGLVPTVRRGFGRFRPVADPAERRGAVAALIALAATVVSTILAGLAGVLSAATTGSAAPSDGLELTALALGTALLGGTSAYGRRGGVLGTVLAAVLVVVAMAYVEAVGHSWSFAAFAAIAMGLGLAATRLVEAFGRPSPGDRDDDDGWSSTHSDGRGGAAASRAGSGAAGTGAVGSGADGSGGSAAGVDDGRSWEPTTTGGLWAPEEVWGPSPR